jgi:hypothetical protein
MGLVLLRIYGIYGIYDAFDKLQETRACPRERLNHVWAPAWARWPPKGPRLTYCMGLLPYPQISPHMKDRHRDQSRSRHGGPKSTMPKSTMIMVTVGSVTPWPNSSCVRHSTKSTQPGLAWEWSVVCTCKTNISTTPISVPKFHPLDLSGFYW